MQSNENLTSREVINECKCSLATYSLCVLQFPRFFIQTTEMITLVVLHGIRTASYQNATAAHTHAVCNNLHSVAPFVNREFS